MVACLQLSVGRGEGEGERERRWLREGREGEERGGGRGERERWGGSLVPRPHPPIRGSGNF